VSAGTIAFSAVLLAALALLVALYAVVQQRALAARTRMLEGARDREQAAERRHADVGASLARSDHAPQLRLYNRGRADAHAVRLRIVEAETDPEVARAFRDCPREIAVLTARADVVLHRLAWSGLPDRYTIELRWRNADASEGLWHAQLSF
jgi:hypothetical protein